MDRFRREAMMKVKRSNWITLGSLLLLLAVIGLAGEAGGQVYPVPDTDQEKCFDDSGEVTPPGSGQAYFGQDAQYETLEQSYADNGDGTVTDLVTGLMWVGDCGEKMTWEEAEAGAETCTVGGYDDWRMPTIKELYSLIQFSGTDPSGPEPYNVIPFIDTDYFIFEYGDTLSGERLIDAQYWSSTIYRGLTMAGDSTAFGVNFADGRIKGYPRDEVGPPGMDFQMTAFAKYVRGTEYGSNQFVDNGDGTVTDLATGLMWQQADDGTGRNWEGALSYAENLELAGYNDWRLPDAHELQSIVDYTRSPQETGSPAIDPVFTCTQIIDEGGEPNYGFYWTGTTHESAVPVNEGEFAVYVAFGEALGWLTTPDSTYVLSDVHGAGAQRSDPKSGDPSQYPHGHGPQGDVVRIYNFVRCVRESDTSGFPEAQIGTGLSLSIPGGNPAPGQVTFQYWSETPDPVSLEVYDCSGRCVAEVACFQSGSVTWSPGNCGAFIVVLSSGDDSVSRRFTVLP